MPSPQRKTGAGPVADPTDVPEFAAWPGAVDDAEGPADGGSVSARERIQRTPTAAMPKATSARLIAMMSFFGITVSFKYSTLRRRRPADVLERRVLQFLDVIG